MGPKGWEMRLTPQEGTPEQLGATIALIKLWLESNAAEWAFQLEKGEEKGNLHFQIGMKLLTRSRKSTLTASLKKAGLIYVGKSYHIAPLSNAVMTEAKGNFRKYFMKDLTRVDGPWTQSDAKAETKDPMPEDLDVPEVMHYPWQKEMTVYCQLPKVEKRLVRIIWDPIGCTGKSYWKKYIDYHGYACTIPAMQNGKDIAQFVCSLYKGKTMPKCFVFDVPRDMKGKKMAEFWSAVEALKDGTCWDARWEGKKRSFTSPRVVVLTNTYPEFDSISPQRWELCTFEDGVLKCVILSNPGMSLPPQDVLAGGVGGGQ